MERRSDRIRPSLGGSSRQNGLIEVDKFDFVVIIRVIVFTTDQIGQFHFIVILDFIVINPDIDVLNAISATGDCSNQKNDNAQSNGDC